jgi:hypothetical protein
LNINNDIYHEKIRIIDVQKEISSLIRSTKDDVVVILRIHLMCESMIEAWVCGAIGKIDFFTKPMELKLSFSDKLRVAYNLSLPKPAYEFFRKINSVRNQFSHKIEIRQIASGLAETLKEITSGLAFSNNYRLSLDTGREIYSLSNPQTPERIKLCLLFLMFTLQLSMELQPKSDDDDKSERGTVTIEMKL